MAFFRHPDATRKLNRAQWKEGNRRHHVQNLWVCGTPAGGGGGGYCHFPSRDFSHGVPRAAHTPLSLSPHKTKEDIPWVWLGSHSQANFKQGSQHPGELWQWGSIHIFLKYHKWAELCTHVDTLRARPEPPVECLQKLLVMISVHWCK